MSSCICPAILPNCHLVTHVGTIFTIFQIRYNESLFLGSIINPTITVLKWLSNCLWSYTKSITLWQILENCLLEQINETFTLFFSLTTLAASSKIAHSLSTFQICSHPELLCDLLCCGYFSHIKSFAWVTLLCGGFHTAVPRNTCDITGQL